MELSGSRVSLNGANVTRIGSFSGRLCAAVAAALATLCLPAADVEAATQLAVEGATDMTYQVPWDYLKASQLLVVVNTNDAQSVAVADEYMAAYSIPADNRLDLAFTKEKVMDEAEFVPVQRDIDNYLASRPQLQGIVVTWTEPWKVAPPGDSVGMSITSAITFGFDPDFYNSEHVTCDVTAKSALYGQELSAPYSDFGLRPAMMLAGETEQDVLELIDRSQRALGTFPQTTGYLVRTTDSARSVRYPQMEDTQDFWTTPLGLKIDYFDNHAGLPADNSIRDESDVLYYFTGLKSVDHLDTLRFVPGAIADHLTSSGGRLTNSSQMSILRWLEAGASGSFGTVAEPCNSTEKFPNVGMVIDRYYVGATLMDAYWQSVKQPGEGIFVGDPLTQPYAPTARLTPGNQVELTTTGLAPGALYKVVGVTGDGTSVTVIEGIHVDSPEPRVLSVPAVYERYRLLDSSRTLSDNGAPAFEPVTKLALADGTTRFDIRAEDSDRVSYALQRSDGRVLEQSGDLFVQVVFDGDIDGNGRVSFEDLGKLKAAIWTSVGMPDYLPEADLNNDGLVNMLDVGLLKRNFGGTRMHVYVHTRLDSASELTVRAFDPWGAEASTKLRPVR
jgi:uncharacterized protein (TIGR03790 family)